jgi:hypothetical protein
LQWQIPVTYSLGEGPPATLLVADKTAEIPNVPLNKGLKLNADGAGYYRVQYDAGLWKQLLDQFPKLDPADRVNLLSDAWALAQADRVPLSVYFGAIEKLPVTAELAEREQVINAFDYIDRLLLGAPTRDLFRKYAIAILQPLFTPLGWDPKVGEEPRSATLRADLIETLGKFADAEIVAGCEQRFQKFLTNPKSLSPDLRSPVFNVVARAANEQTWTKLHELGMQTTSVEEKQNYYDALSHVTDPTLISRTLQIALTDELPTSRASYLVQAVARNSDHPELAWQFAKENMNEILAKVDALAANRYPQSLFTFFSERARIAEIQTYAENNLPAGSAADKAVAQAVDEIGFRSEFKKRLISQLAAWIGQRQSISRFAAPKKSATAKKRRP